MAFHAIDGGRGVLPTLCVEIDVTNAPTNPTRVWTDVTTDIRSLTFTQDGRNDELQRTQPGFATVAFNNRASKYDSGNGSGIGIKRSQWMRVRGQWGGVTYSRWKGILGNITQTWPEAGKDGVATVRAASAMKVANLYDLVGETFVSQASDARVSAIATLIGIPASIADSGVSTLSAITDSFPVRSLASSQLQEIEQSENGQVFSDADGNLVFQSRHYRLQNNGTPLGTLGENSGEIPYRDLSVSLDDGYLFNSVIVTPTNDDGSEGTPQQWADTTSDTANFTRGYDRTIRVSSVDEALACAQYLVERYRDPSPVVPTVEALGVRATSMWPTILGAVYGSRFTVKRRAANTFSEDCYVEQISETVIPGSEWRTTFQLSPAVDQLGWVLGDSVNGLLGSTTVLTY